MTGDSLPSSQKGMRQNYEASQANILLLERVFEFCVYIAYSSNCVILHTKPSVSFKSSSWRNHFPSNASRRPIEVGYLLPINSVIYVASPPVIGA
jgi:hypothetical protein